MIARAVAIVAVATALSLGAGEASAKIVADSGFRPAVNGFSFENYSSGYADLSAREVRMLFGSRACAFVTSAGGCVLTPPGLAWLQQQNRGMSGGHCQGFSVLSLLLFRDLYPAFGPGQTFSLRLKGDVRLQRAIAYAFEWQSLPAVVDASVTGTTPNRVLRFLINVLRRPGGETYGMGIYQFVNGGRTGGHEITPYAVDDLGGGRYDVLLYDNNFPGVTRRLHINTRTDSWSYQASTNPSAKSSLYTGNARTKTLELDPASPGLGVHPCPFCAARRSNRGGYNEIQLEGNPSNHAHLLITDQHGRRLGYVGGRLVTEIPGGNAISPRAVDDWRENQEPIYRIPAGANLTVTVDGSGLRRTDTESLSLIGPNHDVAIESIRILPGEQNTFVVSGSARSFAYRSAPRQSQSPTFDVGLVGASADFRIQLTALAMNPSSAVVAAVDRRDSALTFHAVGTGPQTFRVSLTDYLGGRLRELQTRRVRLGAGQRATIRYGGLAPGQKTIPVVTSG